MFYKVCHGFRLTKLEDYFESPLTTFEAIVTFEAARAVVEFDSSLKPNHHIKNFSEVKLEQICETHCTKCAKYSDSWNEMIILSHF